jgi:hypothetical protein
MEHCLDKNKVPCFPCDFGGMLGKANLFGWRESCQSNAAALLTGRSSPPAWVLEVLVFLLAVNGI